MTLTVAEISQRLSSRVDEVAAMLFPSGKKVNGHWCVGDLSGNDGKSLKVNLRGDFAGHWTDWAETEMRGDLLDLWENVRGITRFEVIRQAKDFLGVRDPLTDDVPRKKYGSVAQSEKRKDIAPNGKAMHYLATERKLDTAIVNRFKIQGDGENIIFPCYSPEGELLNLSYRALKPDAKGKKKVWQETGCAPCLFGWHALNARALKARTILICEGQIDCVTWTQWGFDALSIPNGGGMTWIDFEWEHLEVFDTIFVAFDHDKAGADFAHKTARRLGLHRCRLVVTPSKDANECLKAGCCAADAQKWIDAAQFVEHETLRDVAFFEEKVVEEFWPNKNADLGFAPKYLSTPFGRIAFKLGEVTIWTGVSSHGKTTFLSFLMATAIMDGRRTMIASMEMRPPQIIRRMLCAITSKHNLSPQEVRESIAGLSGGLFFSNVLGFITEQNLFDSMDYAFRRHGVQQIVIDSLMRVAGLDEEYSKQNEFLSRLATFAKETDTCIHLVAHPRKTASESAPERLDVKGSSSLLNNCDNMISIHKNMEKVRLLRDGAKPDDLREMFDSTVTSIKQRDEGWEGSIRFFFHKPTFSYTPAP